MTKASMIFRNEDKPAAKDDQKSEGETQENGKGR
jgi:hypothetical protein